jgi:putative FmdB family regulatory protein
MPFYEYECDECGEKWSVLLSISERDEIEKTLPCPDCGAKGPRRLLSGFATGGSSRGGPMPGGDCGGGGGGGG